ncbi:hypothetical protein FS837_008365 [Tulasnella sp. UAMH 9824]|nr:hypothetical protein FS837_008365 [Tulasnella sp. UAMH 9824]
MSYQRVRDRSPPPLPPPISSGNGQITPSAEHLRPPLDGPNDLESVGKLVDSQNGYASLGTQSAFNPAITEKFALSADPSRWNTETAPNFPEPDDDLHNPDPKRDRWVDNVALYSTRGLLNVGCLLLVATGIFALFAGYPIISHFTQVRMGTNGGYNLGGINDTGQIPEMPGNFGLIDKDTPKAAYTKTSYTYGEEYELVFSDEFNVDGRTFYPGDDPYWEAVDLHYWQTNNLEWYDPGAVTTKDGNLVITLSRKSTHGLNYEGGLISSWNKFCFTGGILEVNAVLPGASDVEGLWPAVWAMGNLGRAGYGASLDGLWPYSYDSCDVGTLPNQTYPDGTPVANTEGNDKHNGGALSYLPGQRLSACTCKSDPTHPGPKKSDGSWTGRAAPEIDVLEATVDPDTKIGHVSQSAQWAPFDYQYHWDNSSSNIFIYDPNKAIPNPYVGGVFQQASSALVETDQNCYELSGGCSSIYGFEYQPGADGFITWISEGVKSWTMMGAGVGPNSISGAGQRLVSEEPMYIIMNLGISLNFGPISEDLQLPAHFLIDYVRVYQPKNAKNIGCNPDDHPTQDYITRYVDAYNNANLTTWEQYGQVMPKNSLVDQC